MLGNDEYLTGRFGVHKYTSISLETTVFKHIMFVLL